MSNEPTVIRKDSPQLPLPVPAPGPPAEATDLQVDVLSMVPLVVGVSGEIDIASASKLREELLSALHRHGARLALDLGGVTFMDCAGVNVLLAARRHARLDGGWVRGRVVVPTPPRAPMNESVRQGWLIELLE